MKTHLLVLSIVLAAFASLSLGGCGLRKKSSGKHPAAQPVAHPSGYGQWK